MSAFPDMVYRWCLPRILNVVVALRLKFRGIAILVATYNYSNQQLLLGRHGLEVDLPGRSTSPRKPIPNQRGCHPNPTQVPLTGKQARIAKQNKPEQPGGR
jgi:hypothetical protein